MQCWPVAFDDEYVVRAAFVHIEGVAVLGVQRVGGDHRAGDVETVQQRGEHGDFVRLRVDLGLAQHDARTVVERGEQMPRGPVGSTSAPDGLAVHRDRSYFPLADWLVTGGLSGGAFGQPARHNLIQRLAIHRAQHAPEGRFAGRSATDTQP